MDPAIIHASKQAYGASMHYYIGKQGAFRFLFGVRGLTIIQIKARTVLFIFGKSRDL